MPTTQQNARTLRKNMTNAERKLWQAIRRRQLSGHKFRRQAPIGRYIVDFVCFEQQLVIEIDGGQHKVQSEYDGQRSAWLNSRGFHVLRFWNHDVLKNLEGVVQRIAEALSHCHPLPGPPPSRGRE